MAQDELSPAETQQDPPPEPPTPLLDDLATAEDDELGYRPLMQGPVHEAFASPIDADPTDGVRVFAKAPPEPVDEQPPEARPQDEEMKWIPGYWSWSDEQSDYVWVSGLWRKLPPGRTWKPGNWTETASGQHRWTPGYWIGEQSSAEAAKYLPVPPKSIDNGPSIAPPGEDYFWVPGCWEYAENNYRWRSGFWSVQPSDWVWQPACYVYTPQGYLLVDGYWDYEPTDRAQLYAPVTFYDPVYLQPNYVYRPRYPLAGAASLLLNLFVRRGYPHYYYGNFYGPSFLSIGYRPWYDVGFGYGLGSPWFGYYDWKYRKSGINFGSSMQRYENELNAGRGGRVLQANVKGLASGDQARVSSASLTSKKLTRSLDDVVRSHSVASAIGRSGPFTKGGSANRVSGIGGLSASSGDFRPGGGSFRGAPSSGFRSNAVGNSSGTGLRSSNANHPSSMFRQPSSSLGVPSNLGRASSFPSIRSNTLPRANLGSSSQFSRSSVGRSFSTPSRNFSTPSRNLGSPGSSPSFQRNHSPSMGRGRSSSGFTGRSSTGGGFNRGGSGGGSRSMGSRGRGKGK